MSDTFLSQEDVDSLLKGVTEDNRRYWAEAFADYTQGTVQDMDYEIKRDVENGQYSFLLPCGDWLYPSKDSSSSVGKAYDLDTPLTLMLFAPYAEKRLMARTGHIWAHLNSSRHVEVVVSEQTSTMEFRSLCNKEEPDFKAPLSWTFNYDLKDLKRLSLCQNFKGNGLQEWAVFVASVLLQDYLKNPSMGKKWGCETLYIRPSTIPEIETIGAW